MKDKAMMMYRGIASRFFFDLPNVKKLKARLSNELTTYQSLVDIINDYESNNI